MSTLFHSDTALPVCVSVWSMMVSVCLCRCLSVRSCFSVSVCNTACLSVCVQWFLYHSGLRWSMMVSVCHHSLVLWISFCFARQEASSLMNSTILRSQNLTTDTRPRPSLFYPILEWSWLRGKRSASLVKKIRQKQTVLEQYSWTTD